MARADSKTLILAALVLAGAAAADDEASHRLRLTASAVRDAEGRYAIDYSLRTDLPDGARVVLRLAGAQGGAALAHGQATVDGGRAAGALGPLARTPLPGEYRLVGHFQPRQQTMAVFQAVGGAGARALTAEALFTVGAERDAAERYLLGKIAFYESLLEVALYHDRLLGEFEIQDARRRAGQPVDRAAWEAVCREGAAFVDEFVGRRRRTAGSALVHEKNSLVTIARGLAVVVGALDDRLTGRSREAASPFVDGLAREAMGDEAPAGPSDPVASFALLFGRARAIYGLAEVEDEWARYWLGRLATAIDGLVATLDDPARPLPDVASLMETADSSRRLVDRVGDGRTTGLLEVSRPAVERRRLLAAWSDRVAGLRESLAAGGGDETVRREVADLAGQVAALQGAIVFRKERGRREVEAARAALDGLARRAAALADGEPPPAADVGQAIRDHAAEIEAFERATGEPAPPEATDRRAALESIGRRLEGPGRDEAAAIVEEIETARGGLFGGTDR